jgi:SHS2 domain-containing protein
MRRYRTTEHTADIGLTAYGESLPRAFENAACGLFSVIADLRNVKEVESRTFELNEESPEDLLYGWLNDLIFLFDTENILFKRCAVSEFDGNHLKATCYGERCDPARHRLKSGVKAATYHMLTVDRERNRVSVILDV